MSNPAPHASSVTLNSIQLRVLGSLIEKEITTPESYPLSLNAVINACNQRSSREPVLDLTQHQVFDALDSLEMMSLVTIARDARVPKYEHRARTVFNLRRDETALLCLLLLRGPQTPGELRSRSDRLYAFDDLAAVQSTLERLASRAPLADGTAQDPNKTTPLTLQLPRQPGAREARYTHLLGGPPALSLIHPPPLALPSTPAPDAVERLEADVQTLREQLVSISERLARLEATALPKPPLN